MDTSEATINKIVKETAQIGRSSCMAASSQRPRNTPSRQAASSWKAIPLYRPTARRASLRFSSGDFVCILTGSFKIGRFGSAGFHRAGNVEARAVLYGELVSGDIAFHLGGFAHVE